jgi:glycosyltransferase involved in cell wall biosynthesis
MEHTIPAQPEPRVAFFTDSFHEVNGVALTSREFAKFARHNRHPFLAVHPAQPSTEEIRHLKDGPFESCELPTGQTVLGLENDLTFDLMFFRHLGPLEKILSGFRPSLVHVTGPGHLGMLGAILAYRIGVPLVASWHTNVHEFGARRLATCLERFPAGFRDPLAEAAEDASLALTVRFYRLAKVLFAPNPELCEMLQSRCQRPVHYMPRGIDCSLYNPAHRVRQTSTFVIGYVGRVSAEKNVRVLAAVEESLQNRGLSDYQIHVVGNGSERPWLQANLKKGVFHGVLKGQALAAAYADMDVLLFPSETDTFGNVVLEAAACGVPSIVTPKGGPKYLVNPGVTGFIAAEREGFADAVLRLAGDRNLHRAMSAAARNSALSRAWSAVFEAIYEQYREGFSSGVLRGKSGGDPRVGNRTFSARPVS